MPFVPGAALVGLTKSVAREVGAFGIAANVIAQGLGAVDDLAQAVAFLAGPAARHITGAVLHVDGGQHMQGGRKAPVFGSEGTPGQHVRSSTVARMPDAPAPSADGASARRHALIVGVVWAVLSAALIALALIAPLQPTAASREARVVDNAFLVLLVVSIPVFVLVEVVVVYSALRFQAVSDEDGPPIAGRKGISIAWVATTTAMVLALAAFGWAGMNEVLHAQHEPDLVVRVVGKQFAWTFEYPSLGVSSTTLRLPKDRLVRFELASTDVLHSFWIPEFRVKQDVVPGRTIAVTATATQVGSYGVLCAELCGLGHTVMRAPVEVVDQVAFDLWAAGAKARAR